MILVEIAINSTSFDRSLITGDWDSVSEGSTSLTINLNQSKITEMNEMFIEALSYYNFVISLNIP